MSAQYRFANRTDPFNKNINQYRSSQLARFDGTHDLHARVYDRDRETDDQLARPTYSHNRTIREHADRNEINKVVFTDRVYRIHFHWDMASEDLRKTSDYLAHLCTLIFQNGRRTHGRLKELFIAIDLEADMPSKAVAQRTQDSRWWRSLLSRECRRRTEQRLREIGQVSKQSGIYLSNFTFAGWQAAAQRSAKAMEDAELIDIESGEIISLETASKGGTAALENRRAELMTRIRGCEEQATARTLEPLFITLTCPSRFHLFSKGKPNPKYNGATPREAQDYLVKLWSQIRAKCGRQQITLYGLRIVEPHHDGCPHWHLLLFVKPGERSSLITIIRSYALKQDGDEPGAIKRRVTIKRLDEAGQAAGYVAKYVAKNIDGFKVGEDHESDGDCATDTAQRVRAWASIWGIRQFDFIGDASVTCYRELRRLARNKERAATVTGETEKTMNAADEGNWAAYSALNGGPCCPREARPIRPYYSEIKPISKVQRVSRYGEVLLAIAGIKTAAGIIVTRCREWVLQFGRDSDPWSCVNNCTVKPHIVSPV